MALDLWGEEIGVEARKEKQSHSARRRPVYRSENNDIDGWFRENMPQTLAECDDVRKTLRQKSRCGNYEGGTYQSRTTGRRLVRLKGPTSSVMIVSAAARKLFNKKLRNREVYLEVLLEQFGTEQADF